jgi:hypothetical protein
MLASKNGRNIRGIYSVIQTNAVFGYTAVLKSKPNIAAANI